MGDPDAFAAFATMVLVAEGDDALPVLKPDRTRGLEARRGEAHQFVEENAAVCVTSAFGHEFEATPGLRHHLCGIIIPHPFALQQGEGWMVIEFGSVCGRKRPHLRLRFIRVASLRPTVEAPRCILPTAASLGSAVTRFSPNLSARYAAVPI